MNKDEDAGETAGIRDTTAGKFHYIKQATPQSTAKHRQALHTLSVPGPPPQLSPASLTHTNSTPNATLTVPKVQPRSVPFPQLPPPSWQAHSFAPAGLALPPPLLSGGLAPVQTMAVGAHWYREIAQRDLRHGTTQQQASEGEESQRLNEARQQTKTKEHQKRGHMKRVPPIPNYKSNTTQRRHQTTWKVGLVVVTEGSKKLKPDTWRT